MPQPSSQAREDWVRMAWWKRGLDGAASHSAKRGVIFQRTRFLGG